MTNMQYEQDIRGKKRLAILLMLLSAMFFSAMQIVIKVSGTSGHFPVIEQAFFRNLISLVGAFFILWRKEVPLFGSKEAQLWMFGRSIAGFLAILTFFYATNHARIADANVLNKLSPFFVTVFSVIFLHERMRKVQYASLAVSFAGAWIVCSPSLDSAPLAMIMALMSALLSGTAYTFIAYLKDKADPLSIILHFSVFSVVCAGICMIPEFVVPTLKEFGLLICIGIFGSFGQITLTYAYKYAPASEISIYTYSGIIWSMLFGQLFLQESIPLSSIVGALLIIGASLVHSHKL